MSIYSEKNSCAVTPIDGRYRAKVHGIQKYVSEEALISYRIKVELLWLEFLLKKIKSKEISAQFDNVDHSIIKVQDLIKKQRGDACDRVKQIEKKTRHDVKAVEYYLKDLLLEEGVSPKHVALLHFACTSEDINNLSYALMMKDLRLNYIQAVMSEVISNLLQFTKETADHVMLSRTHGQAASPTTLGKEIAVFAYRLFQQSNNLKELSIFGKINGAVGNFNAHHVVFSDTNWLLLSKEFVEEQLHCHWNPYTTQIENHDWIAKFCDQIAQISNICIDLSRDIWGYISLEYLTQVKVQGEVGSSTMPHKINPIDFENAEGNFGLCVSLCRHLSNKLPISRYQRDLSDSTVLRSLGTLFGYFAIATNSLIQGIQKVQANRKKMYDELSEHWELLAEPIQMLLRSYGCLDAYERLKDKTRGKLVKKEDIHQMIDEIQEIPNSQKDKLKSLTPTSYIGYAESLALDLVKQIEKDSKTYDGAY